MTQYETILVAPAGAARVITLNRPERRNAISHLLMQELAAAMQAAADEAASRAIIITGAGGAFSAGRDLKEAARSTPGEREAARRAWRHVTDTIEGLRRPVVAAIEGHCLTGGLELALACDLRVAAEGASFGVTSARLGTIPGFGGTQRLPRLVGPSRALEMLFSATPIDVEEAWRIGLINRKSPRGGALAAALEMVAIYAERAPLSLAALKQAVRQGRMLDLPAGLDLEARLGATLTGTEDRAEGLRAFLEKRPPRFSGH